MNALRRIVRRRIAGAALVVACATGAPVAHAGRSCEPFVPTPLGAARALTLAGQVRDRLDASDADVVLVARIGQDLSRRGLRWSHLGFVVRDHPDGRWTVVHVLNECATAESTLYAQGLGTFFLDDMFRYEALVVVPDPRVQRRLKTLLAGDAAVALHESRYSVVAYPFSTRYQNSNQWALELLAMASADAGQVVDRAGAQAWLSRHAYRPTTLAIDALERFGASVTRANIAFDDHPPARRFSGRIDCVTVESIAAFVARDEADSRQFELALVEPWRAR